MTLTINDTTMTSDQTAHTARHAPDRNGWEGVLAPRPDPGPQHRHHRDDPGRPTAEHDLREGHRLWPHIQGWAEELGLTAPDAIAQASPAARRHQPPARTSQPAARPRGSGLNSGTRHRDQHSSPHHQRQLAYFPEKHGVTDVRDR